MLFIITGVLLIAYTLYTDYDYFREVVHTCLYTCVISIQQNFHSECFMRMCWVLLLSKPFQYRKIRFSFTLSARVNHFQWITMATDHHNKCEYFFNLSRSPVHFIYHQIRFSFNMPISVICATCMENERSVHWKKNRWLHSLSSVSARWIMRKVNVYELQQSNIWVTWRVSLFGVSSFNFVLNHCSTRLHIIIQPYTIPGSSPHTSHINIFALPYNVGLIRWE